MDSVDSIFASPGRIVLAVVAFFFVAFGQPAWIWWFGLIASAVGYALILRVIIDFERPKQRFLIGMVWFAATQLVQLSWLVSHPYHYIYPIYFLVSCVIGTQFGLLALFVTRRNFVHLYRLVAIAALWTLMEWGRLYFFSGFTWNPIGIALTGSLYPLQMAAIWGIYGLSFWVMLVNLLAVRAWLQWPACRGLFLCLLAALIPYLFGFFHYHLHVNEMAQHQERDFRAILVQTAFPIEEALSIDSKHEFIGFVIDEWKQILSLVAKQKGKNADLIALPEFTVPFGTYTFVYPIQQVVQAFEIELGSASLALLPPLEAPLALPIETTNGPQVFVNNAYWSQAIANAFGTPILVGLEDAEEVYPGEREHYSAAMYFRPFQHATEEERQMSPFAPYIMADRYEKRVLVPMGEYIPFDFLKTIAAKYGITGSFTNGKEAKVLACGKTPFGISICYEETFGHLMRESRLLGAEILVNLTSDGWYPQSRLPQQHFDHARLRTVESGIPLLRSCNTGITCAIDSLGRVVDTLGGEDLFALQSLSDSLYVEVPTYHYHTLYSQLGDVMIIPFCFIMTAIFLLGSSNKIE